MFKKQMIVLCLLFPKLGQAAQLYLTQEQPSFQETDVDNVVVNTQENTSIVPAPLVLLPPVAGPVVVARQQPAQQCCCVNCCHNCRDCCSGCCNGHSNQSDRVSVGSLGSDNGGFFLNGCNWGFLQCDGCSLPSCPDCSCLNPSQCSLPNCNCPDCSCPDLTCPDCGNCNCPDCGDCPDLGD